VLNNQNKPLTSPITILCMNIQRICGRGTLSNFLNRFTLTRNAVPILTERAAEEEILKLEVRYKIQDNMPKMLIQNTDDVNVPYGSGVSIF
jgi:hypothetical protein